MPASPIFSAFPPRGLANADPGWYTNPSGTLASAATPEELRANGIDVPAIAPARKNNGTTYVCPHHPEVVATEPARCPKCKMKLVPK